MHEMILNVEGMHCDGCVKRIQNVLQKMEGITEVQVSLEEKRVNIKSDRELDSKEIKEKIENLGFEVTNL